MSEESKELVVGAMQPYRLPVKLELLVKLTRVTQKGDLSALEQDLTQEFVVEGLVVEMNDSYLLSVHGMKLLHTVGLL